MNDVINFYDHTSDQQISEVQVTVDDTSGTPSATAQIVGNQLQIDFTGLKGTQGIKGDQGNPGSSIDYPFTLENSLTSSDTTTALTAAMGKFLYDYTSHFLGGVAIDTPLDLDSYQTLPYNLESPSAGSSSSTFKCILVPVTDLNGVNEVIFQPLNFKCSFALLKSNTIEAGTAPDLCNGESVTTLAVGHDPVTKTIPADCNYIYVYKSNKTVFDGEISVSVQIGQISDPLVVMRSDVIDALDSEAVDKPLSAKQGKVLYEYLDNQAGEDTEELTNTNVVEGDIKQYASSGLTRGYIILPVNGAELYGCELSIKNGSPLKYGIQLSQYLPGSSPIYDTGWMTSGNRSVTQANGNVDVQYVSLVFTYISSGYGVPTLQEFIDNADFRVYTTKVIRGGVIQDVAELKAKPQDDFGFLKQSQEVFCLGSSANQNVEALTIADLMTDHNFYQIQSAPIDKAKKRFVINRATSVAKVLGFTEKPFSWDDLSTGSTGHGNDACIFGGNMWVAGGNAIDGSDAKRIYKSNLDGTSTPYDISISDNPNGTLRVIGGVCRYLDDDTLLLPTFDYRGGPSNVSGDLMKVYSYKISTGQATEVFSTDWVGWFIQGATYINGYLYVAINLPPNSLTYTGIGIIKIDAVNWQVVERMDFHGTFEPEGIDSMWDNATPVLYIGVGSTQVNPYIAKIIKVKAF